MSVRVALGASAAARHLPLKQALLFAGSLLVTSGNRRDFLPRTKALPITGTANAGLSRDNQAHGRRLGRGSPGF